MPAKKLTGKRIVVTAGWPYEDIDGVRRYANHRRRESQGYAVAAWLAAQGAEVTVIAPPTDLPPPKGCRVAQRFANGNDIASGRDAMKATDSFVAQISCDAVFCFASISSIRPAHRAKHKLKVKNKGARAVSMAIVGNVDVVARAKRWGVPAIGYNGRQEKFSPLDLPEWLSAITGDVWKKADAAYPQTVFDEGALPRGTKPALSGKKIVLTSGPTEERVTATGDVITNFSSGRQGCELARAFAASGAKVVYVTGPSTVPPPTHKNIQVVRTAGAKDMLAACEACLPADVFVGVAAVADFGCGVPFPLRLVENEKYALALAQNPDILGAMGRRRKQRPALVVGFAAETDARKILEYAKGKLEKKNADLICANLVGRSVAHGKGKNRIFFVARGAKPRPLPVMSKGDAASAIVREITARLTGIRK